VSSLVAMAWGAGAVRGLCGRAGVIFVIEVTAFVDGCSIRMNSTNRGGAVNGPAGGAVSVRSNVMIKPKWAPATQRAQAMRRVGFSHNPDFCVGEGGAREIVKFIVCITIIIIILIKI